MVNTFVAFNTMRECIFGNWSYDDKYVEIKYITILEMYAGNYLVSTGKLKI